MSPQNTLGVASLLYLAQLLTIGQDFLKIAALGTSNEKEAISHLFLAIHSYWQFDDILKTFGIRQAM